MNAGKRQLQIRNAKMLAALLAFAYMVTGIVALGAESNDIHDKITENKCNEGIHAVNVSENIAPESEIKVENNIKDDFHFYEIPEDYAINGGELPEYVQRFAFELCKNNDVRYSVVLAIIEKESGYKSTASGDHGRSKGYMQVMEKWHTERMEKLGVTDLSDPISNISVAVDYLAELQDRYPEELAIMIYNRGFRNSNGTGALDLWEKGKISTGYSEYVLRRAFEIEEVLANEMD